MPYLAQDEMYLHMDSTLYSNSKELGMVIPGGILIDLAIMDLARNVIIKRKLNK